MHELTPGFYLKKSEIFKVYNEVKDDNHVTCCSDSELQNKSLIKTAQ